MAGCNKRLFGLYNLVSKTIPRSQHLHARNLSLYEQHPRRISSLAADYHSNVIWTRCSLYPSIKRATNFTPCRNIYSSVSKYAGDKTIDKGTNEGEKKLSVFQRFKKTYKEHGKVLIGVHVLTSTVWFGTFFYAAKVGVDVIPFMEWIGFSDTIISPFRNSSLGDVALAYLMYKLATPARYTVTLTGTNFAIKYLRKVGRMQPKTESSSLRSLARDSRKEFKEKRGAIRRKTSKIEARVKNKMKAEIKERQAHVKATFTKFRSKLRDKQKKIRKSGKSHQSKR